MTVDDEEIPERPRWCPRVLRRPFRTRGPRAPVGRRAGAGEDLGIAVSEGVEQRLRACQQTGALDGDIGRERLGISDTGGGRPLDRVLDGGERRVVRHRISSRQANARSFVAAT